MLEKLPEIAALAEQHLSASAIASRLGLTKNQVIGVCYRNGVRLLGDDRPKPRLSVQEKQRRPCRRGHSREDAFVYYDRKRRIWVVVCRTCHATTMKRIRPGAIDAEGMTLSQVRTLRLIASRGEQWTVFPMGSGLNTNSAFVLLRRGLVDYRPYLGNCWRITAAGLDYLATAESTPDGPQASLPRLAALDR